MEEALCKEEGPEVEAAASRLEAEVQRPGRWWLGAGLCWEVACTWESCRRPGEEWMAGEAGLKLAREASGGARCPLTDDAGARGAKCRQVWRGGCRWGSGGQGRTDSG